MKIINELLKTHPELKKNKKGVPFLGYKEYDLKYSKNTKKIVDSYSLYTEKLFDLELSPNAIRDCTLDSGDPMKFRIFKPILKELKKINSKYSFYKYTRASGELYSRKRVIEYMNNNDFKDLKNSLDETNVIFTMSTTHALNLILKLIMDYLLLYVNV